MGFCCFVVVSGALRWLMVVFRIVSGGSILVFTFVVYGAHHAGCFCSRAHFCLHDLQSVVLSHKNPFNNSSLVYRSSAFMTLL